MARGQRKGRRGEQGAKDAHGPENLEPASRLDLTGVGCPQNSARALLRLEMLDPGDILELVVDDGEPKENVPPSLEEMGHRVVEMRPREAQWVLRVRRGRD